MWQATFSDSDQQFVSSDELIGLPGLARRGVWTQSQSPYTSQLIFNATFPLQAAVRCISVCPSITLGNETEVIIYGNVIVEQAIDD